MSIGFDHGTLAYGVIDDADDQAAAGTGRDVLVICKLRPRDLKTITARAGIVVHALCVVPAHVLDFDLVVVRAHRERTNLSQPGRNSMVFVCLYVTSRSDVPPFFVSRMPFRQRVIVQQAGQRGI